MRGREVKPQIKDHFSMRFNTFLVSRCLSLQNLQQSRTPLTTSFVHNCSNTSSDATIMNLLSIHPRSRGRRSAFALTFSLLTSLLLFALPTNASAAAAAGEYDEKLTIKPLKGQSVLATFNFKSLGSAQSFNRQMFQLLPRSLGQVLHNSKTKELHLKFTLGRWDAESWGMEPENGHTAGGTGVELWAWVEANDDEEYEPFPWDNV